MMNTEEKLFEIRRKLILTYFQKTGNVTSKDKLDFHKKLKEDASNYLVDTIDINMNMLDTVPSDLVFLYFFDTKDIKDLINLYFEVTNIKIKDLKKLQKANIKFTLKHLDTLPYFSSNVFCAIADELAFYISRYVD